MPLYEFRCDTCSHTFEELVRGNTSPRCPVCGNQTPTRLLSSFAVTGEAASKASGCACDGGGCEGGGCSVPSRPSGGCCGGGGCCH